jgi:hypothetical protein
MDTDELTIRGNQKKSVSILPLNAAFPPTSTKLSTSHYVSIYKLNQVVLYCDENKYVGRRPRIRGPNRGSYFPELHHRHHLLGILLRQRLAA